MHSADSDRDAAVTTVHNELAVSVVSDGPRGPENADGNLSRSRAALRRTRPRLRDGPWQGHLPDGMPPAFAASQRPSLVRTETARWDGGHV